MADDNVRRDDDRQQEGRGRGWMGIIIRFIVASIVPVSYTHLDVYKRQEYSRKKPRELTRTG